MSTFFILQSTVQQAVVFLSDTDNAPVTGLNYADVSVGLKKAGSPDFVPKALSINDFSEIGAGFYSLTLNPTDTDTLGNMYIRVTGASFDPYLVAAYVAAASPSTVPSSPSIATSVLYGYLRKADGSPLVNASVYARPLSVPTVMYAGNDGIGVSTDAVATRSDADGFFSLTLAVGMNVDFTIPAVNFRRTLVVPSGSTNVFDIP